MDSILLPGERRDTVNDNITIIQKADGLTFGTDALLLASYAKYRGERVCEFGCGSGIVSLLMLSRGKAASVLAADAQEELCDTARRNAAINGFEERMTVRCADVRSLRAADGPFDLVVTNPPYMKNGAGLASANSGRNIARREIYGDIGDFLSAAARVLRTGGYFLCVYRPDRLADLLSACRASGIEPKYMTFIHSSPSSRAELLLLEGRAGGGAGGLIVTEPLTVYESDGKTFSPRMREMYESGSIYSDRL